jgi:hypothetical protein
VGLEQGPLSLVRSIEELLEQKSSGSRSRKQRLTAVGTRCTGGGRSVGIVHSRTKATEFFFLIELLVSLSTESSCGLQSIQ